MKGKRLSLVVIFTLALAAMLVVPLASCAGGAGFPTPTASPSISLSTATVCRSVDSQTEEPIEPTATFTPDTSEIFCSVKLSNAPSNTEVSAKWIYIQDEAGSVLNYLIDTRSRTAEGTRYVSFSITRPDGEWPKGDYKVVLYLNDNETLTVSFKVQ